MARKAKEEQKKIEVKDSEELRKTILEYIQKYGWQVRQQYNLSDIRLGEEPLRLVLVSRRELLESEFKNLPNKDVSIPVEIIVESVPTFTIEEKGKDKGSDDIYHHEFSDEAKKALGIKDVVTPSDKGRQTTEKAEAYAAWKKRHKVNYSGE